MLRGSQHILADLTQELADFQSGYQQSLGKCRGKGAVTALTAIERLLAIPRRELDQGSSCGLDPREAASAASLARRR